MSTEKEPDYAGVARKMASKVYPSLEDFDAETGYASCMEARLRSDWETIRLLRALGHHEFCQVVVLRDADTLMPKAQGCTCGLSAHLSKLLEPFTP